MEKSLPRLELDMSGPHGRTPNIGKITERAKEFVDGGAMIFQEINHPEYVFLWPARTDITLKVKTNQTADNAAYTYVREEDLKRLGIKLRGYSTDGAGNIVYGENVLVRMDRRWWNEKQDYLAWKSIGGVIAETQKFKDQTAQDADRAGATGQVSVESHDDDKNLGVVSAPSESKQQVVKKIIGDKGGL